MAMASQISKFLSIFLLPNFMWLPQLQTLLEKKIQINIEPVVQYLITSVCLVQHTVHHVLLHVIEASCMKKTSGNTDAPWNWQQAHSTASSHQCCRGLNLEHARARQQEWDRERERQRWWRMKWMAKEKQRGSKRWQKIWKRDRLNIPCEETQTV